MRLFSVDFLQLSNQITRLLDQRCLWHLRKLQVQLLMEFLQLLDLVLHALSLSPQSQKLVLQLGVELVLDVLIEVLDLFALLLLRFGDFLDCCLNIVSVLGQLFETLLETHCLAFDDFAMFLVDF